MKEMMKILFGVQVSYIITNYLIIDKNLLTMIYLLVK